MESLDLGCQCDFGTDFQEVAWKTDILRDPDECGDDIRTMEWDDEP